MIKAINQEKFYLLRSMITNLPPSIKQSIKKTHDNERLNILSKPHDSLFNTNLVFKQKVQRVLDIFQIKDKTKDEGRINFACKSVDTNILPNLKLDSMNSHGNTKVKDVAEYIFFDDGLYENVNGAPPPKNQRKSNVVYKKATDYIDICLETEILDGDTG